LKQLDRSTMLKCKLINSSWKAVVDSLQEKEVLSNWMTWNATDPLDKDLFQIMPIVQMVNSVGDKNFIYRHGAIKEESFEDGYNPFPSKSLCIDVWQPSSSNNPKLYGLDRMEMHLFLIEHGHHLTCLALHKTPVTPGQLLQILRYLPNLKALTLFQIFLGDSVEQFLKENPLVDGLPKLTHLRVQTTLIDNGLIQWLVDGCGDHLIQLEFAAGFTTALTTGTVWVLEKLEKLTIRQYSGDFLKNMVTLPLLRNLSINLKQVDLKNVSILRFIKQFSTTLEVLNLGPDIELDGFGEPVEWEADETVFPKVTSFSMQVPRWTVRNMGNVQGFQLNILSKFPNLEFLELQRFSENLHHGINEEAIRTYAVTYIKNRGFFEICPKLKTVSVTNVGEVRDLVYHIAVERENLDSLLAEIHERTALYAGWRLVN